MRAFASFIAMFMVIAFTAAHGSHAAVPGSSSGPVRKDDRAEKHIEKGLEYVGQEELEKALDEFRAAAKAAPRMAEAHMLVAEVSLHLERFEDALGALNKALAIEPDNAGLTLAAGRCYVELDNPDMSRMYIDRAVELDPEMAYGYILAGLHFSQTAYMREAIYFLERGTEYVPDDFGTLASLGYAYMVVERYSDAEKSLKRSIELDPVNPYAHLLLGITYVSSGKPEEGLAELDASLGRFESFAMYHAARAAALIELYRFDEALLHADKAIALEPDGLTPLMVRTSVYVDMARLDDAVSDARAAAALDPDNARALNNLGDTLLRVGEFDESVVTLERAIELSGGAGWRGYTVTLCCALINRNAEGDRERAEDLLERLLDEDETDEEAACAYALLGKKKKMLEVLAVLIAKQEYTKKLVMRSVEFDAYRDDPDFIRLISGGPASPE
jgi:tetratricopeptide (TPR) repeat protein